MSSKGADQQDFSSIEEVRQYHTRYLRAINSPLRRKILKALKHGPATVEDLASMTGLELVTLRCHLSILEYGSCVEKSTGGERQVYTLTQEGEVVDYLEQR